MTINISAANLGIAIGNVGGGWLSDQQGVGAISLASIGLATLAMPLTALIGRSIARAATPRLAFPSTHN